MTLSKSCFFKCDAPQGTILGPLLFLLYINDWPNCLSSSIPRMYADDTQVIYTDSDINTMFSLPWCNPILIIAMLSGGPVAQLYLAARVMIVFLVIMLIRIIYLIH